MLHPTVISSRNSI